MYTAEISFSSQETEDENNKFSRNFLPAPRAPARDRSGVWDRYVTTFFTMEVCSSGVPDQQRYHDLHHHKGLIVVVDPRRLKVAALAKK